MIPTPSDERPDSGPNSGSHTKAQDRARRDRARGMSRRCAPQRSRCSLSPQGDATRRTRRQPIETQPRPPTIAGPLRTCPTSIRAPRSGSRPPYRLAPNPQALLGAIRAHERAGDLMRAATLALRAAPFHPDDPALARQAATTLEQATPIYLRIDVSCSSSCTVELDGTVQSHTSFFVTPGRGAPGDRHVRDRSPRDHRERTSRREPRRVPRGRRWAPSSRPSHLRRPLRPTRPIALRSQAAAGASRPRSW
jgi:hypothetical protein